MAMSLVEHEPSDDVEREAVVFALLRERPSADRLALVDEEITEWLEEADEERAAILDRAREEAAAIRMDAHERAEELRLAGERAEAEAQRQGERLVAARREEAEEEALAITDGARQVLLALQSDVVALQQQLTGLVERALTLLPALDGAVAALGAPPRPLPAAAPKRRRLFRRR
jgi:vacuolar-type H+-ATPase subunit H